MTGLGTGVTLVAIKLCCTPCCSFSRPCLCRPDQNRVELAQDVPLERVIGCQRVGSRRSLLVLRLVVVLHPVLGQDVNQVRWRRSGEVGQRDLDVLCLVGPFRVGLVR